MRSSSGSYMPVHTSACSPALHIAQCHAHTTQVQSTHRHAMHTKATWSWQPTYNSRRHTWDPQSKLASQTHHTGELWVQLREPISLDKMENIHGRPSMSLRPPRTNTGPCSHTHVDMIYTHEGKRSYETLCSDTLIEFCFIGSI